MRKNLVFYVVVFVLFITAVLFFNRIYKAIDTYVELTGRHHKVHSYFQNLSRKINDAAVLNPDFVKASASFNGRSLFFTDSATIVGQLNLIKLTVQDSVNIRIVTSLDSIVKLELPWLIKSNVPDSIIKHKSPEHIAAFGNIDALISQGIARSTFLITYGSEQLNQEIVRSRIWMTLFITISGTLLFYTTLSFFNQQSKRKSKERELETVLNRINDGMVSVDNNWRYTYLNDAALAAHPMGRDGTIGKVIWDVHPEMHGTIFWNKYHEAMLTKNVVELESYYAPMDVWFSVKVYPSADGLTIFYKDVTETKKAEEQISKTLKEIKDYKFALDESSIVAITNQKGIITHANENFCKISKYTIDELIGQDHRIINSGHHPKEFIRNLWTTIANGKIWKGELKNKAKDGSIYWVDTTIVPFLNDQGKPYQYIAIRADITMRKEAEEQLIKSEKIYKSIASSIPGSVICLLDQDYRYLLIEGDMLEKLGYSKDKLLGNLAEDVLPPDVFAGISETFKRVLKGEIIVSESSRFGYDLILRFIPLKDENQVVYAIMTVAIDVTALKTAQRDITELNRDLEEKIIRRTAELKKSNEDMEAFSYSVSHDLRAPLRGIVGFASILEEDYGDKLDSEGKRITGVIKSNTMRMGNLIDDLLAFSRMGKQQMLKTLVDTGPMVAEVVHELMQQRTSGIPIRWNIQALPHVKADAHTIRQVWINLLSNAVKYSGSRELSVIDVGAYVADGYTVFYIKDNGVGFDEEYKDKLFKVFQRLHDPEEFEGTGVGLALVEKIVSRHGGKVWAEGKEGKGACFYFSLPEQEQ